MYISVFEIFSIGVGPSSSHTIGPMKSAFQFLNDFIKPNLNKQPAYIKVDLYGSLALTGKGHCTDRAIFMGLLGFTPITVEPSLYQNIIDKLFKVKKISVENIDINIDPEKDLNFHYHEYLEYHENGMKISLYDQNNNLIASQKYYSVGGGFIVTENEINNNNNSKGYNSQNHIEVPYPFTNMTDLRNHCENTKLSIYDIVLANEVALWGSENNVIEKIAGIWEVMDDCITRGLSNYGMLPGSLKIKRRAGNIYQRLAGFNTPMDHLDWINAYAIAVNEENAAGGKVVTAPTNGAAGVIPAVIKHQLDSGGMITSEKTVQKFLLVSGAIGALFKRGASISAAEVGCQGEIGVGCSMAAAGLCAVLGGNASQIENAAEIGMEHNLGLTCDPVGGLVQIPCIERNAMGAVKAINAARLSLYTSAHKISLDAVIEAMKITGKDMSINYRETSQGGLAVVS